MDFHHSHEKQGKVALEKGRRSHRTGQEANLDSKCCCVMDLFKPRRQFELPDLCRMKQKGANEVSLGCDGHNTDTRASGLWWTL